MCVSPCHRTCCRARLQQNTASRTCLYPRVVARLHVADDLWSVGMPLGLRLDGHAALVNVLTVDFLNVKVRRAPVAVAHPAAAKEF